MLSNFWTKLDNTNYFIPAFKLLTVTKHYPHNYTNNTVITNDYWLMIAIWMSTVIGKQNIHEQSDYVNITNPTSLELLEEIIRINLSLTHWVAALSTWWVKLSGVRQSKILCVRQIKILK